MLTLNDGRSELWQWDTGRKLTVDAECSQVHFSNKVFGRSIDMDVVDGVAEIPDILLQTDKELMAWAFIGTPENGYTKISKVFKVNRRNKPADYVFTPADQTTLEEIRGEVDQIKKDLPKTVEQSVNDYFVEHPELFEEEDPTVSEWAKQPQKPEYTAKDVGAIPEGGDETAMVNFQRVRAEVLVALNELGIYNSKTLHVFLKNTSTDPNTAILQLEGEAEADEPPKEVVVRGVADPINLEDAANLRLVEALEQGILDELKNYPLSVNVYDKNAIDEKETSLLQAIEDGDIHVSGAEVGQILKVKAVDDQGHPTAWETVEPPSLGFSLIGEFQLTEDVASATFPLADNESSEIVVQVKVVAASTNTANGQLRIYFDSNKDIFYFNNAIYRGVNVTSSLYRYSASSFFTPIFFGDRYGVASDMQSYSRDSYTTPVKSVTLYSANSGILIGAGTACRVFARKG